ncbi:MAG: XdhC family protein [Lachnospiraceae bacterium]|nr:XdhC family protein [Lachnospiraceae bacterium]
MISVLKEITKEFDAGRSIVLCSIIASSGSSPRGAGAKMAVFEDGHTKGTVGGGAVELICTKKAHEALKEKSSFTEKYILTPNEVNDIGMICGGNVEVYFQYLDCANEIHRAFIDEMLLSLNDNRDAWLINVLKDGIVEQYGIYLKDEGFKFIDEKFYDMVMPAIGFCSNRREYNEFVVYTEPLSTSSITYIFGAGHVGKALAPVLEKTGFNVVVFDNRSEMVTLENTPGAKNVILGDYTNIFEKVSITANDHVIIMTPGHQADFEVLDQTLKTNASYIGCIGSIKKVATTKARLMERGHSEENISRIHSPIGIEIYAETPEEIAVSIAAELIKHRALLSKG